MKTYIKRLSVVMAGLLLLSGCSDGVPDVPLAEQAAGSVEVRISASTDDAEESATGGVTRSSTSLELVRSSTNQTVGLRFTDLAIPRGVAITNAYFQFKAKAANSEATSLTIQGQAVDDPVTFSGTSYNVSSRPVTTASVAWSPTAWTLGSAQRTPDLAPVIQEIVNRPGWSSGNALALIITGTGKRVGWSYDGSAADAPLLHIEYSATATPPTVNRFAATPGSAVKGTRVSFSWAVSDPDGDALRCKLDVNGDGATDYTISNCRTTTSQTHTYTSAGRYWPTLKVTDSANASDVAMTSLHITNSTSVRVAVAGDIACDPGYAYFNGGAGTADKCRMKATSDVVLAMKPDAVMTTGDNQYDDATLEKFMRSYHPTWGRFKAITYPAPGTHEYQSGSAAGYFAYFGAAAGSPSKGYYSYDLGAWHIVVLNTSCSRVGGCGSGSPQERWLRADLAAHPKKCTLAVMKLPLFSSGERRANTGQSAPLWRAVYEAGGELVLSGSDHFYERFARQTPDGALDSVRGVRQFVVGTGGKTTHAFTTVRPNSEARIGSTYGVLKLALNTTSYSWQFVPEAGTATDSGTSACH